MKGPTPVVSSTPHTHPHSFPALDGRLPTHRCSVRSLGTVVCSNNIITPLPNKAFTLQGGTLRTRARWQGRRRGLANHTLEYGAHAHYPNIAVLPLFMPFGPTFSWTFGNTDFLGIRSLILSCCRTYNPSVARYRGGPFAWHNNNVSSTHQQRSVRW